MSLAVVPGNAATLPAHGARREIELVVHHQHFLGLDPKKPASICTGCPERFMKDCGRRSQPPSRCFPTSALNFGSLRSTTPFACAKRSTRSRRCGGCARTPCPGCRAQQRAVSRGGLLLLFFSPLSAALSPPLAAAGFSPFSPSAASPSFGSAACSVVGISDGATAAAAAAASSSSVTSCGTTTVATTGFSSFFSASSALRQLGSRAWIDRPSCRGRLR